MKTKLLRKFRKEWEIVYTYNKFGFNQIYAFPINKNKCKECKNYCTIKGLVFSCLSYSMPVGWKVKMHNKELDRRLKKEIIEIKKQIRK